MTNWEKHPNLDKASRPRWSGARRGYPEPSQVLPPSEGLNRQQRRSQGRYRGFLAKSSRGLHIGPMMIRRSGSSRWTTKERAKLMKLATQ